MKVWGKLAGVLALGVTTAGLGVAPAAAQTPIPAPVVLGAPIVIGAVTPKPKNVGLVKFEGYVQNANIAQITVRAKHNETSLQTFTLSQAMSQKMQTIVDKGGFQYGDKVTIYYDPQTKQAMNFKGKPSRPI
jgi:hypothetical protein